MADFIKPFIYDKKGDNDKYQEKLDPKEEEVPIARSGMGDFDYEKLPVGMKKENLTDNDLLDHFTSKTMMLCINMDNQIAENLEEGKNLERKISTIEKEMEKRKRLYDMCLAIFKEESVEIEKYSEKNKKIDSTINYLQQMIDSWQCLIDDFRKIPDECE